MVHLSFDRPTGRRGGWLLQAYDEVAQLCSHVRGEGGSEALFMAACVVPTDVPLTSHMHVS
jgi:hypothetical protein